MSLHDGDKEVESSLEIQGLAQTQHLALTQPPNEEEKHIFGETFEPRLSEHYAVSLLFTHTVECHT